MEIYLVKEGKGLVPGCDMAEEKIASMKQGQALRCKATFVRNYKNHKRFFEFITQAFDMQEFYDVKKNLRNFLTMRAGYYDLLEHPNGNITYSPQSISFDRMEEPEFQKCFNSCIDIFCKEFDLDRDQLQRVVDFI